MTEFPELTEEHLERAIPVCLRRRLMQGRSGSGEDIAALRSFVGLTQAEFARLRWKSAFIRYAAGSRDTGSRKGAIALLPIAPRQPKIIRENLESSLSAVLDTCWTSPGRDTLQVADCG